MELIKKPIRLNQIGKKIVDQFRIDEDCNVPDVKPDVSRIVLSEGRIQIEEMKPVENYLKVIGKLYYQMLYVTGEGEPKLAALEGKHPFEEMVYVEEGTQESYVVKNTRVEFTTTMIHSRKLSIKAMIELELASQELTQEDITVDVEGNMPLYKKKKPMELLQIHTSKKDTYRMKEELAIPGTKETIGTLLWTDITKRKLDTKLGTEELLLSGELLAFVFYESGDGKIDWVEQSVPFEGRIECGGAQETMYHHAYASLQDISVEPRMDEDGELRTLGIEGTLELQIAIYEEERMELLEDVYSLEQQCILETKDVAYEELVMQNHSKCKVVEQLSLPELKEDILQICHNSGKLQIERMEIVAEGIQIEGVMHICFLYVKANDEVPFETWQGMVPFSYLMESNETCKELRYDITNSLEQLSVTLLGSNEVEVKAVLAFHSFLRKPVQTKVITNVTTESYSMEEIEKRPGIIGYLVKEGDELWDLAKRYCTTVEGIMDINGLTEADVKEGERILIFKENMSIL
ncbi:MAG: DUF3794 domain-containing protein [Lachnospiraceae bacterium]